MIKETLVAKFSDVFNDFKKQILVNFTSHNILVSPFWHRLGVSPSRFVDEGFKSVVIWLHCQSFNNI